MLLSRRSRTRYTVPPSVRPSVRVRSSRTRAPTGRRKEGIPSAFQSTRLCPSVPPFGRPFPVSRPSNEPSVRPSVRCSCLRAGGERVECRKDVRSPESRQPVCQPRECCSGELRRLGPVRGDRRTCTRKLFCEPWPTAPIRMSFSSFLVNKFYFKAMTREVFYKILDKIQENDIRVKKRVPGRQGANEDEGKT